jgi:uncharacterized protein (DUF488 family)
LLDAHLKDGFIVKGKNLNVHRTNKIKNKKTLLKIMVKKEVQKRSQRRFLNDLFKDRVKNLSSQQDQKLGRRITLMKRPK